MEKLQQKKQLLNGNRYNIDEEQKNNMNKKANILIKSGNFTKIFLKNKDFLLRSLNLMKKNNKNQNNHDKDSIDMNEYENKRRKINEIHCCNKQIVVI